MGFVVKLRESESGSDEVRQLVDDYVITPAVAGELPGILDDWKQRFPPPKGRAGRTPRSARTAEMEDNG